MRTAALNTGRAVCACIAFLAVSAESPAVAGLGAGLFWALAQSVLTTDTRNQQQQESTQ